MLRVRHLRYVVAVAEKGSFRRAARALGVDCSVLSRRVRELEGRLGTSLFHRGPGGAELTDAGAQFVPRARKVVDEIGSILDAGSEWRRPTRCYRVQIYIESCTVDGLARHSPSTSDNVPLSKRLQPTLAFTIAEEGGMAFEAAVQSDRHRAETLLTHVMSDVARFMQGGSVRI